MLIGKKGYYFIKVILFFAFSGKESYSIRELAGRLEISDKVLEQVLLALKNTGFLMSKRGPRGGYWLTEDALDLTILDVLDRTGQKIEIMHIEKKEKKNAIDEVLMDVLTIVEKDVSGVMKNITIRDLTDKMGEKITGSELDYSI